MGPDGAVQVPIVERWKQTLLDATEAMSETVSKLREAR
jgi:hypothetical protein